MSSDVSDKLGTGHTNQTVGSTQQIMATRSQSFEKPDLMHEVRMNKWDETLVKVVLLAWDELNSHQRNENSEGFLVVWPLHVDSCFLHE